MHNEDLIKKTSYSEYNKIPTTDNHVIESHMEELGLELKQITNPSSIFESRLEAYQEWRKKSYQYLPDDVRNKVTVFSVTERRHFRTSMDIRLGYILNPESSPEVVREHLEDIYDYMTPFVFLDRYDHQEIDSGGRIYPLRKATDEKRTLFPILRSALPAGLATGAALRNLMTEVSYITARVARPEVNDYKRLEYAVDRHMQHIPEENVINAHTVIIDPVIAGGGSIITAASLIQDLNPSRISVFSLTATFNGLIQVVRNLENTGIPFHVYTADISHLNSHGEVQPWVGDFGNRLHGSEVKGKIRDLGELIELYSPIELDRFYPEIEAILGTAKIDKRLSGPKKLLGDDEAEDYEVPEEV